MRPLAKRHGVRQVEEPFGQGTIVRMYRTDPDAPEYRADSEERRRLLAAQQQARPSRLEDGSSLA